MSLHRLVSGSSNSGWCLQVAITVIKYMPQVDLLVAAAELHHRIAVSHVVGARLSYVNCAGNSGVTECKAQVN